MHFVQRSYFVQREMHTHLVDVGPCLNELTDHHVLSIVAGQMEWSVAIGIHLIDLRKERRNLCLCLVF